MLKEMLHYRWRKTGCIYVHRDTGIWNLCFLPGCILRIRAFISKDIEFYRYKDWNNNDFIIILLWFGGKSESMLLEYRFDIGKKNWRRIVRFTELMGVNWETTNSKYVFNYSWNWSWICMKFEYTALKSNYMKMN